MLKNSMARLFAVAVAAPTLALTMSISASASGNTVHWGNDIFGNCRLVAVEGELDGSNGSRTCTEPGNNGNRQRWH